MDKILEIIDLKKHYPGVKAVDGVTFSIEKGTCFGLLGPNGAGKTTSIEIIEGIKKPTSGTILYKGRKPESAFYSSIGIQFQNTELPQFLTVKETLDLFRKFYHHKADLDYLIELCQLDDILKRDNRKISGGQKQRLLLAMALANDPEIIFLDEPTTGLDPQARRHLWEIVQKIKSEKKTVILTTHYMDEAQILSDTVAIMDHGKIIAMDSPQKLLKEYCSMSSIVLRDFYDRDLLTDSEYEVFETEEGVEIQTSDINKCLQYLIERKIDLSGATIRSQNLEDLFLYLTGSQLRS
ncbi:MAG: ABC transporter ATP-binding protein [Spirochaetes bacterium]|nr:ABC transporter ATP-binding protein [Spirochaetota bacterium]